MMRLISTNNYGNVYISDEEILALVRKYLQSFLSFEIEFSSLNVIETSDFFPVVQVIINAKSPLDFLLEKLDLIAETTEIFLNSNLGLRIAGIQVGVEYGQ